jgi:hypothetical protein
VIVAIARKSSAGHHNFLISPLNMKCYKYIDLNRRVNNAVVVSTYKNAVVISSSAGRRMLL